MKKVKLEKCKWALRKPLYISKDDDRYIFFAKQLKDTGICEPETWGLSRVIVEFTLPRLKLFRKINPARPMGMSKEKWNKILDKMIFAFEFVIMEDDLTEEYTKLDDKGREDYWKRYHEGIRLFADYFMALWW